MSTKREQDCLSIMETLRKQGWLVVLKCQPDGAEWLREMDAGCYDSTGIKTTWCAQAEWNGVSDGPWRHTQTVIKDTPQEALRELGQACRREQERVA